MIIKSQLYKLFMKSVINEQRKIEGNNSEFQIIQIPTEIPLFINQNSQNKLTQAFKKDSVKEVSVKILKDHYAQMIENKIKNHQNFKNKKYNLLDDRKLEQFKKRRKSFTKGKPNKLFLESETFMGISKFNTQDHIKFEIQRSKYFRLNFRYCKGEN